MTNQMIGEELKSKPVVCPRCSSRDVVPILYGMPSHEAFLEAEAGKIALGGCCVSSDDPLYECCTCELAFTPENIERARRKRDRRREEYYESHPADASRDAKPTARCLYCGEELRTPIAKQCRFCHRDWHHGSGPADSILSEN